MEDTKCMQWVEGFIGLLGFAMVGALGGGFAGGIAVVIFTPEIDWMSIGAVAGGLGLPSYLLAKGGYERRADDRRRIESLAREVHRLQEREREREQR